MPKQQATAVIMEAALPRVSTIDVNVEFLLTPNEARREPFFRNSRTGKPKHIATVYRAFHPGFRDVNGSRVRLEFIKRGSGRMTSREAIQRFALRLTNPGEPLPPGKQRR